MSNDSVPAKLKEIAERGYTVWYEVDADEMARVLYEAGIAAVGKAAPKWKDLLEPSKEVYRRQAMALVEVLSGYTSKRFAEIEMYCLAMYRVLLALRGMAAEDGTITDGETTVNLETALGWERPAPFAGMYNRLEALFIAARGLRQLRQSEATGRPGGHAATANVPRRVDDEREHAQAIDALLEMIGALDNTLAAGTPVYEPDTAATAPPQEAPPAPPAPEQTPPGVHYDPPVLTAVESSMITHYAYDEREQRFYVKWKKPAKNPPFGVYSNFDREAFRAFTTAPSKGKHMLDAISGRPDLYPYNYLDKLPF